MKDFRPNNKFGGGGNGGGRGGFRGGNTFGKRDWNGPKQMYDAICAKCGKSCQVPFRPSGERPVYCHDCFDKTKPNAGEVGNFSRSPVQRREPSTVLVPGSMGNGNSEKYEELKRLLDIVNVKLDRLLQKREETVVSKKESLKEVVKDVLRPSQKITSAKKGKTATKKANGKKK